MEVMFSHPIFLALLLAIPMIIVTHYYSFKRVKKNAMKFANFEALKRVTGEGVITKNTRQLVFRVLAVFFLIMAACGPTFWYKGQQNENDYVIAIDTSASMLTEDIPPDRITSAKEVATEFVNSVNSKAQFGIVSFSGIPIVETLLTDDLGLVRNKINGIKIMTAGGTDIGSALVTSTNVLLLGKKSKSIILLTDGSQTTGSFIENSIDGGISYAKNNHVIVNTIGVGTGSGNAVYVPGDMTAAYDKSELARIASETGGKFFEAANRQELTTAFSELTGKNSEAYLSVELSAGFLMIGISLMFVEWGLANTKYRAVP